MHTIMDLWKLILEDLKAELGAVPVSSWFDEMIPAGLEGPMLQLYCPNSFKRETVEQFHVEPLLKCLRGRLSPGAGVRFLTEEEYARLREFRFDRRNLKESFTFETFVVGNSNRMAYHAARAVAEGRNEFCNPLVLYGGSGLGKTHLLNAVAAKLKADAPELSVVCLKGDQFTNEMICAIRSGSGAAFREKYRGAAVFLMDDVQFIAGKAQTQEEFYNTFEALYQAGCSIMITMDRPPRELDRLEARLSGRFEGGLLVEIGEPEYDTRLAIVKQKAAERGLEMQEDEAAGIAERVTGSVRSLEGVLNRLKALRELGMEHGNLSDLVGDLPAASVAAPQPEELIRKVAACYGVEVELLREKNRTRQVMIARQVAMHVLWRKLSLSTTQIGRLMNRDHSTVSYALQSVEQKMRANAVLAAQIRELEQ